ncbi:hypothetical protein LTR56_025541 [Elasticomyces elasticus]|nr:hypothetical protein LTR56_025541 [Elasticomyces elasticus]KAK3620483.1 hypothetical protein LTR22_025582 [Elasticomyces elasticus]KAK4905104.1 hypothetical protein LTR49_025564 [Elasticomyces elasticus]KAK5739975.1 hypothetical protein LTS12_025087 [Elasticomyces elasticus]
MKRDHDAMVAVEGTQEDEDGDADESQKQIPPYDAKLEKLPESSIYTQEFADLGTAIGDIEHILIKAIEDSSFRDGPVNGLLQELATCTQSNVPTAHKVAVFGGMGCGKSTMINNLLNLLQIARSGDGGGSVTWVTNVFGNMLAKQTMAFLAEVFFFSQDECHEIIKTLFASYYRASHEDEEATNEPKDDDQAATDDAIMSSVITAFRALLADHKEFATKFAVTSLLDSAISETDEELVEMLLDWTDALLAKQLGANTTIVYEASTTQTLLWDLAPCQYSVEVRNGRPIVSPWPFVSHIRFGLDNILLNNGVELYDTAGLSDANPYRVINALHHVRQCNYYMVISTVGRGLDDGFLKAQFAKGSERGSGRTMLVLTHCDSISENNDDKGSPKDFQALGRLQIEVDELEEKIDALTTKASKMKGEKKYKQLYDNSVLALELQRKINRITEQRTVMRTKYVTAQMQEAYQKLTHDPIPLSVHGVANEEYLMHQAGYKVSDKKAPCLSVEGTGIPGLRKHLLNAPAEALESEKKHKIQVSLPALLSSCDLWISKRHMARKGELEAVVARSRPAALSCVQKVCGQLKADLESIVCEPFRSEESRWVEEARNISKSWAKAYSTPQHLGFLKNNGVRKGKGRDAVSISWSAELISMNAAEVRRLFLRFIPTLEPVAKVFTKDMKTLVSRIINSIENDPQVALMALDPFLRYLQAERESIGRMMEGVFRSLRKDISNSMTRAMSEQGDNHIAQAMLVVYNEARQIKAGGRGKKGGPKERLTNFERNLCQLGTGVWGRASDALRVELETMAEQHTRVMGKAVEEFFTRIEQKFDMLCCDEKEEVEEEVLLREKLQKAWVLATRKMEDEVLPLAEKCFGRF